MQSKVHPAYKTKYRVANWPAYNRGASAINCYSGGQKLVPARGGREPARAGARNRADVD